MERGSSPRWRGGPGHHLLSGYGSGVIPALAGRTDGPMRWKPVGWGHPRAGGADSWSAYVEHFGCGSSPRWRGGHRSAGCPVRRTGVIPALAGRTAIHNRRHKIGGGHPRAGGADASPSHTSPPGEGSSPRWRGGPPKKIDGYAATGVIPALAGRTRAGDPLVRAARGHPRAGGADVTASIPANKGPGSSPRWRGGR